MYVGIKSTFLNVIRRFMAWVLFMWRHFVHVATNGNVRMTNICGQWSNETMNMAYRKKHTELSSKQSYYNTGIDTVCFIREGAKLVGIDWSLL